MTGKIIISSAMALAAIILHTSAHADPLSDKGDLYLRNRIDATQSVDVITRTRGGFTPQREAQIAKLGGYVFRHLGLVESAAIRIPAKNLPRLAAYPWVARLSANATVEKSDEFIVDSSETDRALAQAPQLSGDGVTVAVLDSGLLNHPDFADSATGRSRLLASVNFAPGSSTNEDLCGHGTHVGGIVAGAGASSIGSEYYRTFYGIAKRARLVSVRVLDSKGCGDVSGVIRGIDWVIANKARYNIRVINLSLGHPVGESYKTDPLCVAVEKAWRAGIVVVCAAGNEGRQQDTPASSLDNEGYGTAYGSIQSPANSPYAITVGAMKSAARGDRQQDRIATYSSRGPSRIDLVAKPDIVAPGNRVISLTANKSYLDRSYAKTNGLPSSAYVWRGKNKSSSDYFVLSGTSMAAPVVSGAVALLLEKEPRLTPDTVKARLMTSADKWVEPDGSADLCTFGAGYLNVAAALRSTVTASVPALSPTLVVGADGTIYLDGSKILWGKSGIWGTGVNDPKGIWGSKVLWGKNTLTSSGNLWHSTVWTNRDSREILSGGVDLTSLAVFGEE